jgi:hypothetical protein
LNVEHDRHLKYVVRIRFAMNSEGYWADVSFPFSETAGHSGLNADKQWPCDISDLIVSQLFHNHTVWPEHHLSGLRKARIRNRALYFRWTMFDRDHIGVPEVQYACKYIDHRNRIPMVLNRQDLDHSLETMTKMRINGTCDGPVVQ